MRLWLLPFTGFNPIPVAGLVSLDALLLSLQGVAMRRMWLDGYVEADMKEYRQVRHAILKEALAEYEGTDLLCLGSDAMDADLADFTEVVGVRVHESDLERLSSLVYGDGDMCALEYAAMEEVAERAIDRYEGFKTFADMCAWLHLRNPAVHVRDVVGSIAMNDLLASSTNAVALLQPLIDVDALLGRATAVAYRYLRGVASEWRDAVMCVLGPVARVDQLVRLPAFIVNKTADQVWRFYQDARSVWRVSEYGSTITEFAKLTAGAVVRAETAGSWLYTRIAGRALPDDGLCYAKLFEPASRDGVITALGKRPLVAEVFSPSNWQQLSLARADAIHVGGLMNEQRVRHVADGPFEGAVTLRQYIATHLADDIVTGARIGATRGHCDKCGFDVKLDGHESRCRSPLVVQANGWSPVRTAAWYGDVLLLLDARLLARLVHPLQAVLWDSFVQRHVCNNALAQYMREYHADLLVEGGTAPGTLFEANYRGDFRENYLRRVFPNHAQSLLSMWRGFDWLSVAPDDDPDPGRGVESRSVGVLRVFDLACVTDWTDTCAVCFSQHDKTNLNGFVGGMFASTVPVLTVHEVQGKQFKRVVLINGEAADYPVGYSTLAIASAMEAFVYVLPRDCEDGLSAMLARSDGQVTVADGVVVTT